MEFWLQIKEWSEEETAVPAAAGERGGSPSEDDYYLSKMEPLEKFLNSERSCG